MWLFKHYLSGPIEFVIKAGVAIPTETAKAHARRLTSYSTIVNYLLIRYRVHNNIVTIDTDIRTFKHKHMTVMDYAQQLWTKTHRCRSRFTENMLNGLFVEVNNRSICRTISQWWSERQSVSLTHLKQKAESLIGLRGNKIRPNNRSDSKRPGAAVNREQIGEASLVSD